MPHDLPTLRLLIPILLVFVLKPAAADIAATHSFEGGDRVVLLGDTFIEREGDRGFIETAIVAAHPEAALTIRNLGWSGDTVWAESRGVFDAPAKGYERMLALVRELAPTVVVVAYGRNESFRGPEGLPAFRGQLQKLCTDLRSASGPKAAAASPTSAGTASPADPRLVLVTPHPFEGAESTARNASLAEYAAAIRDVARAEGAALVDLFADIRRHAAADAALTENGTHLSDAGYAAAAATFVAASGKTLPEGFPASQADLQRLVVEKNRLFFHRWRPANETYIFLFRKHEQGNNAVEIPQFDPLVEAAEAQVRSAARAPR
jgi:lysophospholipase L1-like esterase